MSVLPLRALRASILASSLLFCGLTGCGPKVAPPVAPEVAADAIAPRPSTLEALREALPTGTRITLTMAGAGMPATEQRWTFSACDAEGATIASKVYSPAGDLLEDEGEARSTWKDLMDHAAFPAATTVRTEATVQTPMGTFDAWLYTVTEPGSDGVPVIKTFQFAKTLPGPPVLMVHTREGVEVFRMTMIARTRGEPAAP